MFRDHMQMGLQKKHSPVFSVDVGVSEDIEKRSILQSISKVEGNEVPRNDIAVFMSEETSEEVRNFMKNYLLKDVSDKSSEPNISANDLQKLSNEDVDSILDSMPNRGETLNQYEKRIKDMLEKEKKERSDAFKAARYKKELKEALNKE